MVRNVTFSLAALFLVGLSAVSARGQDDLLAELYGEGVHFYFAGQYAEAHEVFSAVITQGTRDPRCYYFRGVAYHKLGRPDEAENDFQTGAQLEASGDVPIGSIGRSLERIQGSIRLTLEKHRRREKLAVRMGTVQRNRQRYEQFQRDEPRVLRGNDQPVENLPPLPNDTQPDSTDPFGDGPAKQPPPSDTPATTPQPPPANNDPFGDASPIPKPAPATPATSAPADDPFGAPTTPAPTTPAPASPAPLPAAEDDPFAAPAAPAAPATPAPTTPAPASPAPLPAADDDPFATPAATAAPATPTPTTPTPTTPTPASPAPPAKDDPFAADDPFN